MKKYNQQAKQILADAREKADAVFQTLVQINLNRQLAPLSGETRLKFLKEKEETAVKEYEKMCRAWFDIEQHTDQQWIEWLSAFLHDAFDGINPIPPTNEVKYKWPDTPEERVKVISNKLTRLLANRIGFRYYQFHLADLVKSETYQLKLERVKKDSPDDNNLLTNVNTVIFLPKVLSKTHSDADKKWLAEKAELTTNAKKQGKNMVSACCNFTAEILRGALEIGMSKDEWSVFVHSFNKHLLTDFNNYELKGKGEVNILNMVDKVFESVDLLDNPRLKTYFLDSVFKEVIESRTNGNDYWDMAKVEFKKAFQHRRDEYAKSIAFDERKQVKGKIQSPNLTFETLFTDPAYLEKAILLAKKSGIIDQESKYWKGVKEKYTIIALWYFLRETKPPDMVVYAEGQKAIKAIALHFETDIGKNYWLENTEKDALIPDSKAHNFYQTLITKWREIPGNTGPPG